MSGSGWYDPESGITYTGTALDEFIAKLREHKHEYTIPVEWKHESIYEYGGADNRSIVNVPMVQKVTKLRCRCGEEVDRDDDNEKA